MYKSIVNKMNLNVFIAGLHRLGFMQ